MSNKKSEKVRYADEEESQTKRSVGTSKTVCDDVNGEPVDKDCCDKIEYMEKKILCIAEMVLSLSKEVQSMMETLCNCDAKKAKLCGLVQCCSKK